MGVETTDIQWSPTYSVGVAFIDDQHKDLVALLNDFNAAYRAGSDRAQLEVLCTKLTKYAERHFRDEEELMRASAMPPAEVSRHMSEHVWLVEQIFQVYSEIQSEARRGADEMAAFLQRWLLSHVLQSDKAYAEYVTELKDFKPEWAR
jgi:hemerythrin-like metal-binding protein